MPASKSRQEDTKERSRLISEILDACRENFGASLNPNSRLGEELTSGEKKELIAIMEDRYLITPRNSNHIFTPEGLASYVLRHKKSDTEIEEVYLVEAAGVYDDVGFSPTV